MTEDIFLFIKKNKVLLFFVPLFIFSSILGVLQLGKFKLYNNQTGIKIISLVFIYLIITKSIHTPLTYDEAYTFLNYVITGNYFNLGLANNHLFNTLLMGLTTSFNNSEFFLRTPSIIFGILYIFVAFKFSEKYGNNFLVLFIFLFNPLMMDFFSLARGYSISASLNLLAIYLYIYSSHKYKYPLIIFLLWVSSLAIFINLITLGLFMLALLLVSLCFFMNS